MPDLEDPRRREDGSRDLLRPLPGARRQGDDAAGIFREFPPDFFDLIIVDECHRGSARDEPRWRAILEHFAPATQLGMTATPLRDETATPTPTSATRSTSTRSRRASRTASSRRIACIASCSAPTRTAGRPNQGELDRFGREIPDGLYTTKALRARRRRCCTRTEAAAKHLTELPEANGSLGKTIVFCVDQEHADQMRRALHNANADLTRSTPTTSCRIVSDEGDIGRGHLGNFARPRDGRPR